jgi:hypothetical protein
MCAFAWRCGESPYLDNYQIWYRIQPVDNDRGLASRGPGWLKASQLKAALWLALLAVPLAIGLVWGVYLDDSAYVTFRHARNLAAGRELIHTSGATGQSLPRSPLNALLLWPLAELGIPLPQAALVLSTLGWGSAALALYSLGRALRRPVAGVMSAVLVAFSPVVTSALGTEVSWAVALGWIALLATVKRQWNAQTCALVLMLLAHLDSITLALATLVLVTQWMERRRFPLRACLVLAIIAVGWGLMAAWRIVAPPSLPRLRLAEWRHGIQQLLNESEFYWLFLPLALCGGVALLSTTRKALRTGVLWGVIAALTGGLTARAMIVTLGLFLTGLGVDWAIQWIGARKAFRLSRLTLVVGAVLIVGLPLGIAQVSSLWQRYQFRPVVRQALEQQAADWLRAHSDPTATVLASARLAYLADRAPFPCDGSEADQEELPLLLKALSEEPPGYCVSSRSIAWEYLTQTHWFQERYKPLKKFESPYDATSPFTLWGYRGSVLDVEERRPLNVRLPGEMNLVGYAYHPERVQPGDTVHMALFLQATQPITGWFRPVVQMSLPEGAGDWMHWRQMDTTGDCDVPLDWWLPGQTIADRFALEMPADLPVGAYRLDVLMMSSDERGFLLMYQDGDTSPVDRIMLGYVAVPWQGEMDLAKPVDATFEGQIELLGFEAADRVPPGDEFEVVLYWGALRSPEDNYVVFVHLTDAAGQPVAGHDGPPMDGRYPTRAWLPGEIVADTHRLVLDPDIPAGTYRLQVGLYRWPSLERLPVWDSQGVEQADRILFLQSVEVGGPDH